MRRTLIIPRETIGFILPQKTHSKRTTLIISVTVLLLGVTAFVYGESKVSPKCAAVASVQPVATAPGVAPENAEPQPAEKTDTTTTINLPEERKASQPATAQQTIDEQAIRRVDDLFVQAYDRGDAKAVAALFTTDAEYVDESGNVFQGRAAIEESMTGFFAENPDCKLEITIDTIRFIGPGIAVEDGRTTFSLPESSNSIGSRYTTMYVKTDGQWLAASMRDHAPKDRKQHRAQLAQLDWLVGDWVDEGEDSIITFSCQSADDGNFLIRQFTILIGGEEVMSGSQRIGWDPLTGKLRTWIFDSEGAYGEGFWHRDGDTWVLKCAGVMSNGQTASSTSIYTKVNEHTMTWQTVDHEITGVQQPDSEVYTIVRQAPAPAPVITTTVDE